MDFKPFIAQDAGDSWTVAWLEKDGPNWPRKTKQFTSEEAAKALYQELKARPSAQVQQVKYFKS